ncbi:MAG TPA: hypothetical protein VEB22_11450, partial [Phycisphaerales bacterium]|nr:hypothetical protein [Phycisphaerales bacterium]
KEAAFQGHAPQLATAFGLALQGLGNEIIDANLMPMTVVKEAMWREKTKWFTAAAVLALLAGAAMFIRPIFANPTVDPAVKKAIDDTRAEKNRLKGMWTAVESDYKPDPRAVGMLQAVVDRNFMPLVVDDAATMLAAATGNLSQLGADPSGAPTLDFRELDATYAPPGAGAIDPVTNQPVAADPSARGTIKVTMRVAVNRPVGVSDAFMERQLQGWLLKNAKRHNEYEIKNPRWAFQSTSTVDGSGASTPGNPPSSGGGNRLPGFNTPPPAGNPGRRPAVAPGGPQPGGLLPAPGPRERPPLPPGLSGPGGQTPGSDDVEKVAPLPPIGGMAPGSSVTEYLITWDAVLSSMKEAAK